MSKVIRIETNEQIQSTFAAMHELRPHVPAQDYVATINRLRDNSGYRLAAILDGSEAGCVVGYRVGESLAWGTYLYVDDLVTREKDRSKHYGSAMMSWIYDEARRLGIKEVHLDSGVQRHGAHRFYLRERMDIVFYHFRRVLE